MDRSRVVLWLLVIFIPLELSWLAQSQAIVPANSRPAVKHQLPASQPLSRDWDVEAAFPGLRFKNALILKESPARPNEWFLVERTGRVLRFENDREPQNTRVVLDLTQRLGILRDKEQGVLGLAFPPKFGDSNSKSHRDLYVFYAGIEGARNFNRLSRFQISDNPDSTLSSEMVLLDQTDPHPWHNAGCLEFGPDGFLYVGVGDGGGINDEFGNSQRIDRGLFSGILRIDVDRQGGELSHVPPRQPSHGRTFGYFIPNDNPFVGRPGALEEFWSIGLRNPFRFSFDSDTGKLWVGDVGSLEIEEINIASRGSNHQWSYREGLEPFIYSAMEGKQPEEPIGTESPPLFTYPQSAGTHCTQEGSCVIGGAVYRGTRHPTLNGKYLFGDYTTGRIWAMSLTEGAPDKPVELLQFPSSGQRRLSSFAFDRAGEIYLVTGAGAGESSVIYRLQPTAASKESLPKLLSQTGLFSNIRSLTPTPGLIPYEINAPLWSNGTEKKRWIGLPENGKIYVTEDGSWSFPNGTIFVKHFDAPESDSENQPHKLETRVLVRCDRSDGPGIFGATYRWNANQTDAVLVDHAGENCEIQLPTSSGDLAVQDYRLPSRNECLHCHNHHAGMVLGVNPRQLNRTIPALEVNQLTHWSRLGLFSRKLTILETSKSKTFLPIRGTGKTLERRVRSYLDINCSHCHRAGAEIRAFFDLRAETPLKSTGLLNGIVAADLKIDGAKALIAGDADRSILYQRIIHKDSRFRMPPLATSVVDHVAAQEIWTWIKRLPSEN